MNPLAPEPLRILVVDDNRDAAQTMALLLHVLGYESRCAHDGLDALEMLPEFKPAVVILDPGMPRLDGFETARRIRALYDKESILLISHSGWGDDETRRKVREAGIDAHTEKPLALEELLRLLSQHLPR